MKSLIVIVMDESGSMGNKKADIIGGFNEFLREQKELPDDIATAIFIKFNTQVIIVNESKPIMEVAELTNTSYNPGGGTALYDAIWEGVQLGEKVEPTVDRVLCLIMTDGEENSSRKITATGIRDLMKKKENEGKWTFLYIGENPERWAKETGTWIGNTIQYDHSAPMANFQHQAQAVCDFRMGSQPQQQCLLRPEPPTGPILSAIPSSPPPPYSSK